MKKSWKVALVADDTVPGMAEAIEQRMKIRGLTPSSFVVLSGLTEPGLAPARKGVRKRYAAKTIHGIASALKWPLDWYERLLAGEDWRIFPDTEHPDEPLSDRARITALELEVARLHDALVEVLAAIRLVSDRLPPTAQ